MISLISCHSILVGNPTVKMDIFIIDITLWNQWVAKKVSNKLHLLLVKLDGGCLLGVNE